MNAIAPVLMLAAILVILLGCAAGGWVWERYDDRKRNVAKNADRETDRIERGSRVQNTEDHENRKGKGSVIGKAFGGKKQAGGKGGKGGGKKR